MVIYSAVNSSTGNHWRGVYTPDILAVGEGPATYSDFFSRQKRWAYGIWQIARRHSPGILPKLPTLRQKLSFFALQSHYPTTAMSRRVRPRRATRCERSVPISSGRRRRPFPSRPGWRSGTITRRCTCGRR